MKMKKNLMKQRERVERKQNRATRKASETAYKYLQIHDYALLLALHDEGLGQTRVSRIFNRRAEYLVEFLNNNDAGVEYALHHLKSECKRIFKDLHFVQDVE